MYSLVLMAAFTPGADPVPVVGGAPVAIGCTGCGGYAVSSGCYGSCSGCSGCYGSCHGGHFLGLRGNGLFGHKRSCHGCCGGCTGHSCSGWSCFGSCTGSCYGFGTLSGTPWQGHAGCHGGCWGSTWGAPVMAGGYGCMGSGGGVITIPEATTGGAGTGTGTKTGDTKTGTGKGTSANIKFRLPAEAKLYVDGQLTTLTGSERAFTTPPLTDGKFYYDVKAEVVVDGKSVVEEKRVIVEAGANLDESFTTLLVAAKDKATAVAGK